jgi:hypothetical protein
MFTISRSVIVSVAKYLQSLFQVLNGMISCMPLGVADRRSANSSNVFARGLRTDACHYGGRGSERKVRSLLE